MALRISLFLAFFLLNVSAQAQAPGRDGADPDAAVETEVKKNLSRIAEGPGSIVYAEKVYLLRAGKVLCAYAAADQALLRRCLDEVIAMAETSNVKGFENLCRIATENEPQARSAPAKKSQAAPESRRSSCRSEALAAAKEMNDFRSREQGSGKLSKVDEVKAIRALKKDILDASNGFGRSAAPGATEALRPGVR